MRVTLLRANYKEVWNSISGTADEAKFAVAGCLDEGALRHAAEVTIDILRSTVGISPEDVILEIGAGVGRVGALLAPQCKKWIGADVSDNMVRHIKDRLSHLGNVEAVALSGWDLSGIPSESVDVVYSTVVFMHLDEWERFCYVREGLRILRPAGRMFVDNVNLCSDEGWAIFMKVLEHCHPTERHPSISKCSTPEELRTYFQRAGFSAIVQREQGPWIMTYGRKPPQV